MKLASITAGLALSTVTFVAILGAEPTRDEICHTNYSRLHRMPFAESSKIKRHMIPPGHKSSEYELDHIVPALPWWLQQLIKSSASDLG